MAALIGPCLPGRLEPIACTLSGASSAPGHPVLVAGFVRPGRICVPSHVDLGAAPLVFAVVTDARGRTLGWVPPRWLAF